MKRMKTNRIRTAAALLWAALLLQLPVYSAQPQQAKSAYVPCLQQVQQELPVPAPLPPQQELPVPQLTPDLLAQIDSIIDDTVAQALAAQKAEYLKQAAAERKKAAQTLLGLERSRNFWRSTALTACAALAAGICTGIVLYRAAR